MQVLFETELAMTRGLLLVCLLKEWVGCSLLWRMLTVVYDTLFA